MMLSNVDIMGAINRGEMLISPFDADDGRNLTPAGFNFSFTRFIVSLNKKMFYRVVSSPVDTKHNELYFWLDGGDTALALTRETIWVSNKYAGTFHSKVGYVSQGLGHISTTLDPGWMGQLLISVNNPNKDAIKVVIGQEDRETHEIVYSTFITLCLFKLLTPANQLSDNSSARLDVLFNILSQNKKESKDFAALKKNITKLNNLLLAQNQQKMCGFARKETLSPKEQEIIKDCHDEVLRRLEELQPEIERVVEDMAADERQGKDDDGKSEAALR